MLSFPCLCLTFHLRLFVYDTSAGLYNFLLFCPAVLFATLTELSKDFLFDSLLTQQIEQMCLFAVSLFKCCPCSKCFLLLTTVLSKCCPSVVMQDSVSSSRQAFRLSIASPLSIYRQYSTLFFLSQLFVLCTFYPQNAIPDEGVRKLENVCIWTIT